MRKKREKNSIEDSELFDEIDEFYEDDAGEISELIRNNDRKEYTEELNEIIDDINNVNINNDKSKK